MCMPGRRTGFTLIEVLVALVILATLAGVLVVSLPGFDQRRVEREAERLAALLELACEQAELAGRSLGIHIGAQAYGFSLADRERWLPYPASHRFHERTVDGATLVARDTELPPMPDYDAPPQAVCWPSGELSDLDLRFIHDERERVRVRTGADQRPRIEISDDGRSWRPMTAMP